MSVRTYNPSVRVGNWNEDIALEEVLYSFPFEIFWNNQIIDIGYYKRLPVQERKWGVAGSKDTQFAADHLKASTTADFTRWPLTFRGQSLSVAYSHKNSSFSIYDYLCCPRSNLSSTIITSCISTISGTMH